MNHQEFVRYIDENELEYLRFILKKTGVGTWVRDNLRDLARVDGPLINMFGMQGRWKPGQWIPFTDEILPMVTDLSWADQNKIRSVFSGEDPDNHFIVHHKINRPDNTIKSCEVRVEVHIRDENGVPLTITGVNIDTTELFAVKQKAYLDPVSETHNRVRLYDDFARGIQINQGNRGRLLLLLDLDLFKEINDSMGHHVGDLAIREFAKSVASAMRYNDSLYRLGGDEFVVVTGPIYRTVTESFIERILSRIASIQRPSSISCSVGAVYIDKTMKLDDVLLLADQELYKVKNNEKGNYSLI